MFHLTHAIRNSPTLASSIAAAVADADATTVSEEDEEKHKATAVTVSSSTTSTTSVRVAKTTSTRSVAVAAAAISSIDNPFRRTATHVFPNISEEDDENEEDSDGLVLHEGNDSHQQDDRTIKKKMKTTTTTTIKCDHRKKKNIKKKKRKKTIDRHHQQQFDDDHDESIVLGMDVVDVVEKDRETRETYPCVTFSNEIYRDIDHNNVITYYRCFANCIGRDVFLYEYPINPQPSPIQSDDNTVVKDDNKVFRERQWYTSSRPNENFYTCTFAMHKSRRKQRRRPKCTTENEKHERGDDGDDDDHHLEQQSHILCVGGATQSILIIDVNTGDLLVELIGSSGEIFDLKASPKPPQDDRPRPPRVSATTVDRHNDDDTQKTMIDNYNYPSESTNLLCSASTSEIRIWNLDTFACVCIFGGDPGGHRGDVYSVAWHLSGHQIVSSGNDRTVRIWTIDGNTCESGKRIQEAIQASNNITYFDNNDEVGSNDDNDINIRINNRSQFHSITERFPWSIHTGVHTFIHEDSTIDCVTWMGDVIVSKACEGEIKLWLPKENPNSNTSRYLTSNNNATEGNNGTDDKNDDDGANFIPIKTYIYSEPDPIYFVRFALSAGGGSINSDGCSYKESHENENNENSSHSFVAATVNSDYSEMHLEGQKEKTLKRQQQQKVQSKKKKSFQTRQEQQQQAFGTDNHDNDDDLYSSTNRIAGKGSLSGVKLAVGNSLGQVFVWDIEPNDSTRPTQKLNNNYKNMKKKGLSLLSPSSTTAMSIPSASLMRGIVFSPEGTTLVGCDDNYTVFRWDQKDPLNV
jgi:hypothetical protein